MDQNHFTDIITHNFTFVIFLFIYYQLYLVKHQHLDLFKKSRILKNKKIKPEKYKKTILNL
jgi:hypothetical protein